MAVVSIATLKSYFETGDVPTQSQFIDVFDSFPRRLFSSNTSLTHTGSTGETTIATFTVPGGSLGPNGSLHFIYLLKWTNNANAKTMRVKMAGQTLMTLSPTTNQTIRHYLILSNRNSESSQVQGALSGGATSVGFNTSSSADISTWSINTAVDQSVTLTVVLANAADTAGFEMFECNLWPAP
jgi:hypothetical protein